METWSALDVPRLHIYFSTLAGTKRRGGPGGLNKACVVSPELQTIVGGPAISRTEVWVDRSSCCSIKRQFLILFYPVIFHFRGKLMLFSDPDCKTAMGVH